MRRNRLSGSHLRCLDVDEVTTVLVKHRTIKRISYKIKRALKSKTPEEPKKIATLTDIENKLKHYEKTQGKASFTGPRAAGSESKS